MKTCRQGRIVSRSLIAPLRCINQEQFHLRIGPTSRLTSSNHDAINFHVNNLDKLSNRRNVSGFVE